MDVWVKGKPVVLIPGMTIRQALVRTNFFKEVEKGAKVFDEWGNEMGLDGALEDGMRLEVRSPGEGFPKTGHK